MEDGDRSIKVLMLPWLAHGHISPFFELAKRLSRRNFCIYFCSTPANLVSIKDKVPQKYAKSIQLVELHLPSFPELPPHYHTTKGLPPSLMPALKRAFDLSSPNFAKILETLSPDLLIYDFLQPWAPALALSLNIPAVVFFSTGASMSALFTHLSNNPEAEFPFPAIYLRDHEKANFNQLLQVSANDVSSRQRTEQCCKLSSGIVLIKTFKEIEEKYINYLSRLFDKKVVPVGPLVEEQAPDEEDGKEIIQWLDKKRRSSTVFVSFGSEFFPSKEEIKEIAYGLELANVNFIWVLRFHAGDKISVEEALPGGFLGRVGDRRGKVVEGWAPQGRVLRHSSIGGFVSHCGWGSVMESMRFGVPIIGMPMHLDQPVNVRLVEELGVGVEVKRDKNGRIQRKELARVIKEVVVERSGENVRKTVKEMSENMRKNGDEEIDEAVKEIASLFMQCNA